MGRGWGDFVVLTAGLKVHLMFHNVGLKKRFGSVARIKGYTNNTLDLSFNLKSVTLDGYI